MHWSDMPALCIVTPDQQREKCWFWDRYWKPQNLLGKVVERCYWEHPYVIPSSGRNACLLCPPLEATGWHTTNWRICNSLLSVVPMMLKPGRFWYAMVVQTARTRQYKPLISMTVVKIKRDGESALQVTVEGSTAYHLELAKDCMPCF